MSEISVAGLSPDDVGARISVRRSVRNGIDQAVGDVIGELEALDADQLTIRRSDGTLVVIAAADVVAAKVVGPSPRAARDLEALSGRGWPAPDEAWLGKWWLRAAGGFTSRANTVRPLGDAGVPLDEALARAGAWYTERGLPTVIRSVVGSSIDDELDRRGWISEHESSMRTATLASMRRRLIGVPSASSASSASSVELGAAPTSTWLMRYDTSRQGTITPVALSVLTGAPDVVFATIESAAPDAPAVAIGRAAIEAPWVGFAAIDVDPKFRRRGYARVVMAALVEAAALRGATRAYLEVMANNPAAISLYAALGFTEHHRYTYRRPS